MKIFVIIISAFQYNIPYLLDDYGTPCLTVTITIQLLYSGVGGSSQVLHFAGIFIQLEYGETILSKRTPKCLQGNKKHHVFLHMVGLWKSAEIYISNLQMYCISLESKQIKLALSISKQAQYICENRKNNRDSEQCKQKQIVLVAGNRRGDHLYKNTGVTTGGHAPTWN